MQRPTRCWKCRTVSHVTEPRVGVVSKKCPRCGMDAWGDPVFNKHDRRKGTAYYVPRLTEVLRCGREINQLSTMGLYNYNPKSRQTDVLDAWLPVHR
jgi:hypothetical protein